MLLNCLVLILHLYTYFLSLRHHFSLIKHYLDLYITDTALKISRSLYCFTTSISHGVENYFPRLWGTGISDAILQYLFYTVYYLTITLQMARATVMNLFLYEEIFNNILLPFSLCSNFNTFDFLSLLGCSGFVFKNIFLAIFLLRRLIQTPESSFLYPS